MVMVESDSPADRSGLLVGDIIVTAAGQMVAEPQDVAELLGAEQVGSTLELRVVRGGELRWLHWLHWPQDAAPALADLVGALVTVVRDETARSRSEHSKRQREPTIA